MFSCHARSTGGRNGLILVRPSPANDAIRLGVMQVSIHPVIGKIFSHSTVRTERDPKPTIFPTSAGGAIVDVVVEQMVGSGISQVRSGDARRARRSGILTLIFSAGANGAVLRAVVGGCVCLVVSQEITNSAVSASSRGFNAAVLSTLANGAIRFVVVAGRTSPFIFQTLPLHALQTRGGRRLVLVRSTTTNGAVGLEIMKGGIRTGIT
mmetsp:Transcript_14994/g.27882  ORF Transcript_14994/g.27882 Transcript_14994/m.27882 type:complete len:209 (-) Transcript_14994:1399-2025(-)